MMNKFFNYAFIGAIALTGATMFAGCSSTDDATAEDTSNPNYNPQTKEVTTQFVLNVATNTGENVTRQSATVVQKNSNFRGMKDAKLIGLSTGKSGWLAPFAGSTTGYDVDKTYDLGTLYASGSVNNTGDNNTTSSSRRVLELALPLKTDAMLVYARAIPETVTGTVDADAVNGKVAMTIGSTPETTSFELQKRINGRLVEFQHTSALAMAIFNRIMSSFATPAGAGEALNGYKATGALPEITWKGIASEKKGGATLAPLAEILANAYITLSTFRDGEYRAGSGPAICSMVFNLYKIASNVYAATATTDEELNAQRLAGVIKSRIENYFNNPGNETGESRIQFKTIGTVGTTGDLADNLATALGLTPTQYNDRFGQAKSGDLNTFPVSFNLPMGVSLLTYTDANGFDYKTTGNSLIDKSATLDVDHYMYPSELLYFDNSALRITDVEKKANDYPNGVNPWNNDAWTGWEVGAVKSTTRSVAVKNNINYGVSMLETKVALSGTSFNDNRNAIVSSEENQVLTAAELGSMKLTGVLIGGQYSKLGWNYLPVGNTDTDRNYVIFDNQINGTGTINVDESNYTLVFDNYSSAGTGQNDVLVALEFENNAKDFYGKNNMIRYGGRFYLIGKLELGAKTIAAEKWDANYAIPPYTDAGESQKITRIFVQDYVTTATFKITENSLKEAFVTVPDLRSTQTSLGLSVDLQWREGLVFENVELGQ